MLIDGLTLLEGSSAQNLTVAKGTSFPSLPTEGELFYRTDGVNEGLYVYTGEAWTQAGGNAFDPSGNQTITGTWSFSNPVAVGTPTAGNHAVTKDYADAVASGVDPKDSVRAATTANITLSGTQTVDGVSLAVGDRVLVKNQTLGTQNGLYVVAAGAWTRTSDFDGSPASEVTSGAYTFVTGGATNGQKGFILTTNDPITIGSTPLSWTQFNGVGTSVDLTGATGNLATSNLNSGTNASATTFWRGDGTWSTAVTSVAVSGGTTGLTVSNSPITSSGTITLGGTLGIANGGTGQTTASAALNALLPTQTGNSGKALVTDGTSATWTTIAGGTTLSATGSATTLFANSGSTAGVYAGLRGTSAAIYLSQTSSVSGERVWRLWGLNNSGASELRLDLMNDNDSAATNFLLFNRSANTPSLMTVNAPLTVVGTVTGTTFSGSGASLTALNASNLSTGTVGTARLGSGTANSSSYLRGDGTWSAVSDATSVTATAQPTGTNSFSTLAVNVGIFNGTQPFIQFMNPSAAANAKKFDINMDPSTSEVSFVFTNDSNGTANKVFSITRSGITAPLITLNSTGINLAVGTAGLQLNGSAGTSGQVLTSNGASAAPTWQTPPATSLTSTYVAYGSGTNTMTGSVALTFTSGTNTLSIGTAGNTAVINGTDASTGTSPAASLTVRAGTGSGFSTNAGSTIVAGGSYTGTNNGSGGNLTLRGGDSSGGGTGVGGNVIISGGTGTGNVGGYISFSTSSAAGQAVTERLRFLANGAWSVGSNGTSTGTSGQVLTSTGSTTPPTWQSVSTTVLLGSGSVAGYSATTSAMNIGSQGIFMVNGSATTDNHVISQTVTSAGAYNLNVVNDSGTAVTAISVARSGTTATNITLAGTAITLTGAVTGTSFSGPLTGALVGSSNQAVGVASTATIAGVLSGAASGTFNGRATLALVSSSATAGNRVWGRQVDGSGNLYEYLFDDTQSAGVAWMQVVRSANTATNITLTGTAITAAARVDFSKSYTETNNTATAVASTTIDCSLGNIFTVTMSASITTLTLSNVPATGRAFSLTLILAQDATGGRAITWPAAVKWPNGTAPTLSGANKVDIVTLVTTNNGTTWYGLVSGQNY